MAYWFDTLRNVVSIGTNPASFLPAWFSKLVNVLAVFFVVVGLMGVLVFVLLGWGFSHSAQPHDEELTSEEMREMPASRWPDSADMDRAAPAPVAADSLAGGRR